MPLLGSCSGSLLSSCRISRLSALYTSNFRHHDATSRNDEVATATGVRNELLALLYLQPFLHHISSHSKARARTPRWPPSTSEECANFEARKPQSDEREDAFKRAKGWIRIMEAVGTDMLQASNSRGPGIIN